MNREQRFERDEPLLSPAETLRLIVRYPLLVLLSGLTCGVLALFWVGSREPVWEASARLLIRDDVSREGPLNPFHVLRDVPTASGEMAMLTAQGPARETVRGHREGESVERHLGLTTLVEDLSLSPLEALFQRLAGVELAPARVSARAVRTHAGAPAQVELAFLEPGAVHLSGERGERDLAWRPGHSLAYDGLELELELEGDVFGRRYRVHVRDEEAAVRDVQDRTLAYETEPGSGVVEVLYADSDPVRAAATVNALCHNYLALRRAQVQARSREQAGRIEEEIDRVRGELSSAQADLDELQRLHPLSIEPEDSAKFLVQGLANLETDLASAELERSLVTEAIDELRAGRIEGLSKVAESTADKSTRILIEHASQLQAQAELQGRADAGAYRHVVQNQLLQLRTQGEALGAEADSLEQTLALLRSDGAQALGRLGDAGSARLDAITVLLLERVARLTSELDELLAGDYLPEHPEVLRKEEALADHLERIEAQLESRLADLRLRGKRHAEFQAETEGILSAHPAQESREIRTALDRLRGVLLGHLENLREALDQRVGSLGTEIERLNRELKRLPVSERAQLGPLQRARGFERRMEELLAAREAAKLAGSLAEPPAEILQLAQVPSQRQSPRLLFASLVATLLGLATGILGTFVLDRLRGSLQGPEELEEAVGARVLSRTPDLGRRRSLQDGLRLVRFELRRRPRGALAAAFRTLRVQLCSVFPEVQVLGVTSAARGEGKTATAVGLAVSLASARERVLLVGCSPPDSWIQPASEDGDQPGLAQCLAGRAHWRDVVEPSGFEGVDLFSAGLPSAVLSDLFVGETARELLEELQECYRLVIFDLPSLDQGAEALAMAVELENLLVVCRRRGVPRVQVCRAIDSIRAAGLRLLGLVWNEAKGAPLESGSLRLIVPRRRFRVDRSWKDSKAA